MRTLISKLVGFIVEKIQLIYLFILYTFRLILRTNIINTNGFKNLNMIILNGAR